MRSVAIIFVPQGTRRDDVLAAVRQHAEGAEVVEMPAKHSREPVADIEELPLWQWFTF